jgi:hypothetical protein
MTISDLYHIWGYKDYYQLPGTTYGTFDPTFKIAPIDHLLRCPLCGSKKSNSS